MGYIDNKVKVTVIESKCPKYKVGDVYEEQYPSWTKHLLDTGFIEKVELKKNEVVQEKQKQA